MEQIGEHGGRSPRADQAFGLERLDRGFTQPLAFGVQQPAKGTADAIGLKRSLQDLRLEQDGQACQRPLTGGGGRQGRQGGPQMILHVRRYADLLAIEDCGDPFSRPAAFGVIVNVSERLKCDGLGRIVRQRTAEIMPVALHGQRRCADRAAEIESEDLGAGIAPELQRHQRQQHRFSGAGRADH